MRSSSTRSAPISSDPHHTFDLLQGEDVDSLDDMDDDMFDGMFGSVFGADLFAFLFSDFMRASHGGRHHRRGRGSRRGGRGGGGGGRGGGGGGIDADFFPFPGACTAALRSTSPPPATSLPPVACLWSCLNPLSPSTTSAHSYMRRVQAFLCMTHIQMSHPFGSKACLAAAVAAAATDDMVAVQTKTTAGASSNSSSSPRHRPQSHRQLGVHHQCSCPVQKSRSAAQQPVCSCSWDLLAMHTVVWGSSPGSSWTA